MTKYYFKIYVNLSKKIQKRYGNSEMLYRH